MSYDAFLSYAREDAREAIDLLAQLEGEGLSIWLDRAPIRLGATQTEQLVPFGSRFDYVIREAIDRAASFVYLDTPHWRASDYCPREYERARERGKRVVGIRRPALPAFDTEPEVVIGPGNVAGLAGAIRDALELGHAHARFVADAPEPGRWTWIGSAAGSAAHARKVSAADLGGFGMHLPEDAELRVHDALTRARRRRRALIAAATLLLVVNAVLVVVAVLARGVARDERARAREQAREVESLSLAASSLSQPNTRARILTAIRAVELDPNPSAVAALRSGTAAFDVGTDVRIPAPQPPGALAVSDNGRTTAVASLGEALTIVVVGEDVSRRVVPARTIRASQRVAVAPDGSRVAVVRSDGGAVELVTPAGRRTAVPDLTDVADIEFASNTQLVAFRRDGAVLTLDPTARGAARLTRATDVPGPMRAGAIASRSADGSALTVATLDDRATVTVTSLAEGRTEREFELADPDAGASVPGKYRLGRDHVRVCDGRLQVQTTTRGTPFAVPYTIDERGHVSQVGSMLIAQGSICLPTGDALYADVPRGQHSVPTEGIKLLDVAPDARANVPYAIASSSNGEWASSAGSDGTLALRRVAVAPRARELPTLGTAAADGDSLVVASGDRIATVTNGALRRVRGGDITGSTGRGAYEDPERGAVLPVGPRIVVVQDGRARVAARDHEPIDGIRPGADGESVVAVTSSRERVLIAALDGRGRMRAVRLPRGWRKADLAVWDAVQISRDELALATGDGRIRILSARDGRELRSRPVGEPGRTILASAGPGRLAVGGPDGSVALVDAVTLERRNRVKVIPLGVADLSADVGAGRLLVRSLGDEATVLTLPELERLADVGPLSGLVAASLADRGRKVVFGTNVETADRAADGSVGEWPVCELCAGRPARLKSYAAGLLRRPASGRRPSFVPR